MTDFYPTTSVDGLKDQFPFPQLTRISGEPDYTALNTLYKQIKANAKAIHSTLGGGANGHLGMVLTAAAYARVSPNTAWTIPAHPGSLVIPHGTTQHVTDHLREVHREELHNFNLATSLARIFKSQIIRAIDVAYLSSEIDDDTNDLLHDIPTTMQNLFTEYGQIESDHIRTQEQAIRDKHFDPQLPFAPLYKDIEKLIDFADAGQLPFSAAQQLDIALEAFKKMQIFGSAIEKWFDKPTADKTWANLKVHFNLQRAKMKKAGTLQAKDSQFQANALREIVIDGLQQWAANNAMHHLPYPPADDDAASPPDLTPASSSDSSEQTPDPYSAYFAQFTHQHDKKFDTFKSEMMGLLKKYTNEKKSTNKSDEKKPPFAYCWTHGFRGHLGKDCKNKGEGHKDEATKDNRMGGSKRGCTN